MMTNILILTCIIGFVINVIAKQNDYTTPVPILKQINRQNKDGSYSYGYEAADQSYKIETKYPNGEVYGKYGYVDDRGMLREIEYGASKRGFEPQGIDINVPPPTEPQTNENMLSALGPNDTDDGQYREDPSIYYDFKKTNGNSYTKQSRRNEKLQPSTFIQPKTQNLRQRQNEPNVALQKKEYSSEHQQQQYYQSSQLVSNFDADKYYKSQQQQQHPSLFQENAQPPQKYRVQTYQQSDQKPNNYNNKYYQSSNYQDIFSGHPATNIDINTGSYSLTYTG